MNIYDKFILKNWALVLFLSSMISPAQTGTILVLPIMMKSHLIELKGMAQELTSRGHEVVMAISDKWKEDHKVKISDTKIKIERYHFPESHISYIQPDAENIMASGAINPTTSILERIDFITATYNIECESMLIDLDFIQRLKQYNFDIAIVENFNLGICNSIVPHYLNIPYVSFYATFPDPVFQRTTLYPSFMSHYLNPGFSDQMPFGYRLLNVLLFTFNMLYATGVGLRNNTLVEIYRRDESYTTWRDLAKDSRLLLTAQDFILLPPQPLQPHVKLVGCASHSPPKPLPDNLKSFLDSGNEGVIIVSMGSILENHLEETNSQLIKTFSMLPYKVLWKTKLDQVRDDIDKNKIHLAEWIPQNDVLAHKNVKLFIGHCGKKGTLEAIYHGVPIVGIPFFGDQFSTCKSIKSRKYGTYFNFKSFNPPEVAHTIDDIINDNTVYKRLTLASENLKAIKSTPAELTADWVEYAMKYDTSHLRSNSLDMPGYQYYMLDILCVVFVIINVTLALMYLLCKCMLKKCFLKTKTKVE